MSPQVLATIGGILAGIGLSGLLIRLLSRHFVTTSLSIIAVAGMLLMGYSAVLYTKLVIDEKVAEVTTALTAPQRQAQDVANKVSGSVSDKFGQLRNLVGK